MHCEYLPASPVCNLQAKPRAISMKPEPAGQQSNWKHEEKSILLLLRAASTRKSSGRISGRPIQMRQPRQCRAWRAVGLSSSRQPVCLCGISLRSVSSPALQFSRPASYRSLSPVGRPARPEVDNWSAGSGGARVQLACSAGLNRCRASKRASDTY